eukprot:s115_g34.t1
MPQCHDSSFFCRKILCTPAFRHSMATAEELLQELERERAARQELEEALQKAAEYGCQLSAQVQEQQQTILEYREKVQSFEETPSVKSQAQSFRRMSQSRRASTVAFGSDTMSKVAFLPGSADSDDEEKKRPLTSATQRRGRGGKTMMVEDLLQHSQSLEEDVRRLQQKLEEQEDSDEDSDEGQLRPKRRSRKGSRPIQVEDHNEEEVWVEEDSEVQISNLRQQLQEARKEFATKQRALEAEVDAKKQEIQEHRQAEQDAKASSSQSVAKLKALQKQCDLLMEENQEAENQLRMARTKEHELTLQLEEQTLRNEARHSRRNWMPTACEEALRSAAGASLADEFQDMEGEEEDELELQEDKSQGGDAASMAKVETLQLELENAKAVATRERQQIEERLATSEAEAAKEIQQLQERLEAAKAETAAAVQQKEILQEHLQAVMAESSKLRKELQVLQECKEVRLGEERSEEEESFWSRVISTIACARTPSKPNTSARHGSPSKESVRLAIPAEQASTGNKEGGLTDTS